MKILFISPSAGDTYYCGNCFRDNLLAQALLKQGHDVIIMPLYLPMKISTQGVPVFFPATSYYLEQALFKKGKMPSWMRKAVGSPKMLGLAASLSGTTSAAGMEGMTMSMIEGLDGAFLKNMEDMVAWMRSDGLPDVVHLSSSLLIGIARFIKEELGIPVVCSLQDEEVWIDSLKEEYVSKAWEAVSRNAAYVDRFITSSNYYRQIALERMPSLKDPEVIYPGVDIDHYRNLTQPSDPTIGFFYRMNALDGLDLVAQAFVDLKRRGTVPGLKLRVGGGAMGSSDKKFLEKVKEILAPYQEDVTFVPYSVDSHADFYPQISVLSVPLRFNEGVGLYLCEAFASGRPAVEPRSGSFPEITDGAGLLYDPESPQALTDTLEKVLTDRDLYGRLSARALELSGSRYNGDVMARRLLEVYESVI